ncbi:hypothetical protein AAHA92_24272 [Salvia divinorum]|uniref:Uncharacterized protein n=1 Tax=Salvia divinorum TaxID=28513 RepID=A0ABD1GA10_SALDI
MDFHSLSRRELQALCKRNKLPANVTSVDMADSLQALDIVEGVDEVLQACKSEISESSIEPRSMLEITSPYLPPTGGRSTRQKDVLSTPAQSVASRRRRIAGKEDSALKQICGTRRSARLVEKSAKLLQGFTSFSKKDLFTGEGLSNHSDNATEDEVSNHSDNAPQSKLKEGVDANTLTSVPKIEEEHLSTLDTDGLDAVQTSETKVEAEIIEENIAEDVELVDEPVVENGADESDSVNASEINLVENAAAALPSFIKQPTLSTPKRASTRMIRESSDSDNKENIDSGSKTAPAKERSKIVKEITETVPMLDNPSLVKLSKKLKELALTQKSDKNEGENGASARTALQPLSDNQKAN